MTSYTIQPGIVLARVCGEALLVATREARGKCPYVKELNVTGAYFWTLLEQGMDPDAMVLAASERFGLSPEAVRPGLLRFLDSLRDNGYLLPEADA